MFVLTFLKQVNVGLIAHEKSVAAITRPNARGVELVAVTEVHTVETATHKRRHRVCRTV